MGLLSCFQVFRANTAPFFWPSVFLCTHIEWDLPPAAVDIFHVNLFERNEQIMCKKHSSVCFFSQMTGLFKTYCTTFKAPPPQRQTSLTTGTLLNLCECLCSQVGGVQVYNGSCSARLYYNWIEFTSFLIVAVIVHEDVAVWDRFECMFNGVGAHNTFNQWNLIES